MQFEQALKYVRSAGMLGSRLGLESITRLLAQLGNPHKKLKYVHVAGTNGKGSTTAFIGSILTAAGYKTGLYTSPHIHRINERMKINGIDISDEQFARVTETVQGAIEKLIAAGEEHPTQFEIITAIAFEYFYEEQCDFVVLEVGLGGRLDATNVIDVPEVAVITAIGLDHMEQLGDTLRHIAFEKGGIIKSDADVVLYAQGDEAEREIERICAEKGARLHRSDFGSVVTHKSTECMQKFSWGQYVHLEIALLGKYQIRNAVLALHAIEILNAKGYHITGQAVSEGLRLTKWPGRFELLNHEPAFIIDGAHNMPGIKALEESIQAYFPNKKITFLMGVLADKQYALMLQCLIPYARRFITVTPDSPRALASSELAEIIRQYHNEVIACDSVEHGVQTALRLSTGDEVICACGSLYMVGTIQNCFPLAEGQAGQEVKNELLDA